MRQSSQRQSQIPSPTMNPLRLFLSTPRLMCKTRQCYLVRSAVTVAQPRRLYGGGQWRARQYVTPVACTSRLEIRCGPSRSRESRITLPKRRLPIPAEGTLPDLVSRTLAQIHWRLVIPMAPAPGEDAVTVPGARKVAMAVLHITTGSPRRLRWRRWLLLCRSSRYPPTGRSRSHPGELSILLTALIRTERWLLVRTVTPP